MSLEINGGLSNLIQRSKLSPTSILTPFLRLNVLPCQIFQRMDHHPPPKMLHTCLRSHSVCTHNDDENWMFFYLLFLSYAIYSSLPKFLKLKGLFRSIPLVFLPTA